MIRPIWAATGDDLFLHAVDPDQIGCMGEAYCEDPARTGSPWTAVIRLGPPHRGSQRMFCPNCERRLGEARDIALIVDRIVHRATKAHP